MKVVCRIGYPSYEGRKRSDWDAYNATMAVKGASFGGYANLRISGKLHKITAENTQPVVDFFGQWVASVANDMDAGAKLIILPSSNCVEFGVDPKAVRFADSIRRAGAVNKVHLPFRWSEAMPKTAGGSGTRNSAILQDKLLFGGSSNFSRAILVDDVMTSGAHLQAAARSILDYGITPVGGICFARTVWERPKNIMAMVEDELVI